MDYIINEKSLSGQYNSIEDFANSGAVTLANILSKVKKFGISVLYKQKDFYNSKITQNKYFYDIFGTSDSIIPDGLRSLKSQLAFLFNKPFWDDDPQQDLNEKYFLIRDGFPDEDVSLSGIAEASSRKACLISFTPSTYNFEPLKIKMQHNTGPIIINNVWKADNILEILRETSTISNEDYFRNKYCSLINFSKVSPKNGINLINESNFSLFNKAFEKLDMLDMNSIRQDEGLDYKEFKKNKDTRMYFKIEEWNLGIYKFRVNDEIRCFGNRIKGVFYLLRIDLNHILSDKG